LLTLLFFLFIFKGDLTKTEKETFMTTHSLASAKKRWRYLLFCRKSGTSWECEKSGLTKWKYIWKYFPSALSIKHHHFKILKLSVREDWNLNICPKVASLQTSRWKKKTLKQSSKFDIIFTHNHTWYLCCVWDFLVCYFIKSKYGRFKYLIRIL
jgi:hypothetical protein